VDPLADDDGWLYAPSWGSASWKSHHRAKLSFVRRRKWVRVRVPKAMLEERGRDGDGAESIVREPPYAAQRESDTVVIGESALGERV